MPAHRAAARARPADVAAQQEQVDQHADVDRTVDVLGETHAIDADHALGRDIDCRCLTDRRLRQPAFALDRIPAGRAAAADEFIEALRVLRDEGVVDHRILARRACRIIGFDHAFAQAEDRRDIAPGLDLEIVVGDFCLLAGQHRARALRIDKRHQPLLDHRVERDDLAAAIFQRLQRMQKARTVRTRVLPEEEERVGVLQIVPHHGADGRTDHLGQPDRGRFVAHVRALRQVVVAISAGQQRVEIRGFEPGVARGIEHRALALDATQFCADIRKCVVPRYRFVAVCDGIEAQGVGEPPGLLQVVVAPFAQAGDGMRVVVPEFGCAAVRRLLPQRGLGAVLAEFERRIVGRLGPGA